MRCDRRRSELRLAACAASIYLVTNMTTNLLNLTHTTAAGISRLISPEDSPKIGADSRPLLPGSRSLPAN